MSEPRLRARCGYPEPPCGDCTMCKLAATWLAKSGMTFDDAIKMNPRQMLRIHGIGRKAVRLFHGYDWGKRYPAPPTPTPKTWLQRAHRIEVDSCGGCPFNRQLRCMHPATRCRDNIEHRTTPDWCPLRDAVTIIAGPSRLEGK